YGRCFHCYCVCFFMHSFPTRRSSDLFVVHGRGDFGVDDDGGVGCRDGGGGFGEYHGMWGNRGFFSHGPRELQRVGGVVFAEAHEDRKSTRLNSSHVKISYAVFCLKKK